MAERADMARAVFVRRNGMKEAWCLVSRREDLSGKEKALWSGLRDSNP